MAAAEEAAFEQLVGWAAGRLASLMGLDADEADSADDMARYLCSMDDPVELKDYVAGLLENAGSKAVAKFTRDFIQRRSGVVAGIQTPAMTTYKKAEDEVAAAQASALAASSAAGGSTAAAQAGAQGAQAGTRGAPSDVSHAPASTAAAGKSENADTSQSKTTTKKKKKKKATAAAAAPPADGEAGEAASAADEEDIPAWAAESNATMMSSFFASKAMPQLKSASKSISEGPNQPKKVKPKYVNFLSRMADGGAVDMLPGRNFCECLAAKHKLVNNCLQCGRIVCEQEGMGPCMHCGSLVVTREKQELLRRNSVQARKFLEKLMRECGMDAGVDLDVFRQSAIQQCTSATAESLARANLRRERLLEFDKNSAQRTKVIDDEADYFNADGNKWLSRKERDAVRDREDTLRRKKEEKRKERTVTIDLLGRRVIDDAPTVVDVYEEARLEEDRRAAEASAAAAANELASTFSPGEGSDALDNPMLEGVAPRPEFRAAAVVHDLPEREEKPAKRKERIQDKALAEMTDAGKCMSMHQPWASLLVYGIKMHEGRVWYSPHRGRLWIAAAAKVPDQEEIDNLEAMYRAVYGPDAVFPKEYPTACLLGFVDVEDVLPQDEYRERFPDGDSGMPYVFVCNNPHELIVRYPMKGQHKIYDLDKTTHENAKACVRPVEVTWSRK